jgi:hypothetical protein
MATRDVVSIQGVASAKQGEGADRADKAEGRQYARPEVHDLGSLELVRGFHTGIESDSTCWYYRP